ncbi:MAG TPA: hypothetical protein VKB87_23695 [Myxococcaceae bacterium]|nr:hypothetical protein [Myxococcaceae bacterium]
MKKSAIGVSGVVLVFSLVAFAGNQQVIKVAPRVSVVSGVSPSACDGVDGNLVANCGFETGDFTGWTQSGDLSFTSVEIGSPVAHTGSYGGRFGPVNDLGFITQVLATAAGGTYNLTFWLRNANSPNEFVVIWDGTVIFDQTTKPDFDYMLVEFDGLPASMDGTQLDFGFYNLPDYFYIDDIVVVPN